MPKYEQQADHDATSGADEVEREQRIGPEVCSEHGWVGGAAYYRDGHDKHDRRDSSG